MTDNLDSISRLLGNIEANTESLDKKVEGVFNRMDTMRQAHSDLIMLVKDHESRVNLIQTELEAKIRPAVESVNALKQRGIGAITVISLVSGGAGALLAKLSKLFTV